MKEEQEEYFGPARKPRVYCSKCEEWKTDLQTEFINIEENQFGEDLLTFKCKACSKINKSLVVV